MQTSPDHSRTLLETFRFAGELFFAFLRLGLTAFGGPAMVAYIKDLAIKKNNWLSEEPTCMVFATWVVEGAKDHTSCPVLQGEKEEVLAAYLSQFQFE